MSIATGLIRRLVYIAGTVVGLLALIPIWGIITLFLRDTSRAASAMNPYHRLIFPLLGIHVEKSWSEGYDPKRGAIFLANHQSWLDIPLVIGWVRPVAFLAKKELFRIPILSFAMRRIRCIVVDRGNREANRDVGDKMVENLAEGYSYCVFPEGTRSATGELAPFRSGIFRILAGQPVEVIPVTIDGAVRVFPKTSWGMYPGKIKVTVHDPIPAEEVAQMEYDQLQERVRQTITSALPPSSAISQ